MLHPPEWRNAKIGIFFLFLIKLLTQDIPALVHLEDDFSDLVYLVLLFLCYYESLGSQTFYEIARKLWNCLVRFLILSWKFDSLERRSYLLTIIFFVTCMNVKKLIIVCVKEQFMRIMVTKKSRKELTVFFIFKFLRMWSKFFKNPLKMP